MIDLFSLAVSHGLIMLTVWRLVTGGGLDEGESARPPFKKGRMPKGPGPDA